jgi:hypothetical protein
VKIKIAVKQKTTKIKRNRNHISFEPSTMLGTGPAKDEPSASLSTSLSSGYFQTHTDNKVILVTQNIGVQSTYFGETAAVAKLLGRDLPQGITFPYNVHSFLSFDPAKDGLGWLIIHRKIFPADRFDFFEHAT